MAFARSVHRHLRRLTERAVGAPDSTYDCIAPCLGSDAPRDSAVIAARDRARQEFTHRLQPGSGTRCLSLLLGGLGLASIGILSSGWVGQSTGMDTEVVVILAGILIVLSLLAFALGLAAKRKFVVADGGATVTPAFPTGDTPESAQIAVVQDATGDWTWSVLHLETRAESTDRATTRAAATEQIERLQATIGSAGLLEVSESAFRLAADRDGAWRWTLVRADGSRVSAATREFDGRDDAETAVSFLKEHGPDADLIDVEGGAFTLAEHRERWHWQLVDDERTPLAESETGYAGQEEADAAAETFADRFAQAEVLDVDHVGVELHERGDGWAWRIVDDADTVVADSIGTFDTRRDAESAANAVLPALESVAVIVSGEPTFERYRSGGEWHWRLVDETDHVIARSAAGTPERGGTDRAIERFGETARDAAVVEIEAAEYEVYPASETAEDRTAPAAGTDSRSAAVADGAGTPVPETAAETTDAESGWHWRLVTDDREVVAASSDPYADAESASAAIERVREQARDAEFIEFENAAFRVYESDAGEWRWRLLDEDGTVLADSGAEHASRGDAAEAMLTLKEQAPDADVLEIETAAFELFVTADDEWGWRLIDGTGRLVAKDPATHPTREAARGAMIRLLDHLESDVRTMDRPIFQVSGADDWHWRFVLPTGETVAVAATTDPTRDALVENLSAVRETAATAGDASIDDVAIQLYDSGDWHWRLLDRDREELADGTGSYPDREAALEAVETLTSHADEAPIFTIEDAAIRLDDGDGWSWDLVDRDREVIASAATAVDTKRELVADIADVRRLAPLAEPVEFGVASFDLVATEDDRWRWQLRDEDGRVVAIGSDRYDSKETARDAVSEVRRLIDRASVLAIDSAAFELHADDDEWVWRLVDEYDSTMVESTQTYATRTAAREAIADLKAHVPDGEITVDE
ncbi:YegP family protein [Halosolutus halophilus]|uniref:YegP family protein n=1 Tax=Halosolutus halophilus TaxID=1552990 RepID=UPI00223511AC|nr:YegP family protein [Halosolutus halophilus]